MQNQHALDYDALKDAVIGLLHADTEFGGAAFYDDDAWRAAYARLQWLVGYEGDTTVYDSVCRDFDSLAIERD